MCKKILWFAAAAVVTTLMFASCKHRVDIYTHAPDEPIVVKLDINIYQRYVVLEEERRAEAAKEEAEPEVSPGDETEKESPPPSGEKESKVGDVFLQLLGIGVAHAETASDQGQLKRVRDSMRKRTPTLNKYKADKSIGENRRGLVEGRPSPKMSNAKYARAVKAVIAAENADRRLMYKIYARIDGTSVQRQAITYAKVLRDKARPGWWIEVFVNKKWVWKQK